MVEGEAAVRRDVGHPVEVAVKRLQGELSGGFADGRRICMMCECVGVSRAPGVAVVAVMP